MKTRPLGGVIVAMRAGALSRAALVAAALPVVVACARGASRADEPAHVRAIADAIERHAAGTGTPRRVAADPAMTRALAPALRRRGDWTLVTTSSEDGYRVVHVSRDDEATGVHLELEPILLSWRSSSHTIDVTRTRPEALHRSRRPIAPGAPLAAGDLVQVRFLASAPAATGARGWLEGESTDGEAVRLPLGMAAIGDTRRPHALWTVVPRDLRSHRIVIAPIGAATIESVELRALARDPADHATIVAVPW